MLLFFITVKFLLMSTRPLVTRNQFSRNTILVAIFFLDEERNTTILYSYLLIQKRFIVKKDS
jgi:hypothetical protein